MMRVNRGFVKNLMKWVSIALFLISPWVALLYSREYDIEQYHVPNAHLLDIVSTVKLCENEVIQQITIVEDGFTGFDLVLSGPKGFVAYEILDQDGNIVRGGGFRNAGEVRVTKVRFTPDPASKGKTYSVRFLRSAEDCGIIAHSDQKFCQGCKLFIDSTEIEGNLNFTPVYKATSATMFVRVIGSRLFENIIFYFR